MAMNFRIPCTPNRPCDDGRPPSGTGPCLLHTPPASGWPLTEFAHDGESTRAAAERAIAEGYALGKYADPVEDGREGLTAEEAAEIAQQDASLLYVVLAAEPPATYRIVTVSGRGLPATVDADGYDTRLAAEAMADAEHDGEYRIEAE